MSRSVLSYVASDLTKTGLYVSFSCYYSGASPQPVPFLSPWTTDKPFSTQGAPGCYNQAHIVASSPALAGLTDTSVSNWSCSVHEIFHTFPKEFIPLAIGANIGGPNSIRFGDGSYGVPYILARGATLRPVACGDNTPEKPEECDNGVGCTPQCKCMVGYVKNTPLTKACQLINLCDTLAWRLPNAVSCTPGPNSRTITCAAGFYPIGGVMASTQITLTGTQPFAGCTSSNLCTIYEIGRASCRERV